jgi:hypothetical protein
MSKTKQEVTKIKVPKKALSAEPEITKVDLSKLPVKKEKVKKEVKSEVKDPVEKVKDAIQESKSIDMDAHQPPKDVQKVEIRDIESTDEKPTEESKKEKVETKDVLEEIKVEEKKPAPVKTKTTESVKQNIPQRKLPENVEKLVSFMEETGGNVEDYVRLNADYSNINEDVLLKEYYMKTKPHLNNDEVNFIMEENFKFDTEIDEERDVKIKQLAKKEAIAKAKNFLEDLKVKYYDEIKLRPGVTQEQQKAMDFFNRYHENQEIGQQQHEKFLDETKNLLSDEFEGFEYNVGDKRFRYKIKNPLELADNQKDISTFTQKFLDKEGNVTDPLGYHKAIYSATNADQIAHHFYEQGKADATRDINASSKNISTKVRESSPNVNVGGIKMRVVSGDDSSKLRIKTRKF